MEILKELDVNIESVRLDRYYGFTFYVKQSPTSKVYIIPRKNSKLRQGNEWIETMKRVFSES